MSNWECTLERLRELGGVAENITLSEGNYGRGLFPINSKLPIRLVVPNDLLLPDDWLKLDENHGFVLTDDCCWSDDKKAFYLDYLNDFGLTADVKLQIIDHQHALYQLPDSIKAMLKGFGMRESLFDQPNSTSWLDVFKFSRRIHFKDQLVMMPLLELANHDERSKTKFVRDSDISISGKFPGEILVNYQIAGDAALMYQTYGFSTLKPYAFSGALAINLGSKIIRIARYINLYNKVDKTYVPKVSVEGDEINLSFLVVGSLNDRNSPKKIFVKLMQDVGMPTHVAADVFDGIVNMNRQFFKNLLNDLETLDGGVVNGLRTMVKNQLAALEYR